MTELLVLCHKNAFRLNTILLVLNGNILSSHMYVFVYQHNNFQFWQKKKTISVNKKGNVELPFSCCIK